MIIKVCGLKDKSQIESLSEEGVDMVGINFYEPSARFFTDNADGLEKIKAKKVGIFVNHSYEEIKEKAIEFSLDYAQLHGNENAELVNKTAEFIPVIKAFPHTEISNTSLLEGYMGASYFLFDTATKDHGGSGKKFDWQDLSNYELDKPFLLAGGISEADVNNIKNILKIQTFAGVDINSKFEIKPGIKNIESIIKFKKELLA